MSLLGVMGALRRNTIEGLGGGGKGREQSRDSLRLPTG